MKKIILKKKSTDTRKRVGYKINYKDELNQAQYDAVMHTNGAALVIAGAGTGKTRTLIYRVARLIEDGVIPEAILLLTFTRKSASEMLRRASLILDGRCEQVSGGTFHSFAMRILRRYADVLGYNRSFTILDSSDSQDVINILRNELKVNKSKKRFPQKATINKINSMSVNKRLSIAEVIELEFPNFIEQTENIEIIAQKYKAYKLQYNLMDYDDLLVNLLRLMKEFPDIRKQINGQYKYIMADEYQDTNRLQHEIVLQLSGEHSNIMAVGDDAQSIYAFRGAEYQNIMFFPNSFEECKIYKIEENYRSSQEILNLCNEVINTAAFKYDKELYSEREGELPKIISAANERQQSEFLSQQILELREQGIALDEIAVLFRSGYLSFDLEIELSRANIPFKKFGGLKFGETAHVKDLLAFLRVLQNPKDAVSWQRLLMMLSGVGPATASKVIAAINEGKAGISNYTDMNLKGKVKDNVERLFGKLSEIKNSKMSPGEKTSSFAEFYKTDLKNQYDDWKKRWKDIESFVTISERYTSMSSFLNDMALDPPTEKVSQVDPKAKEEEYITLSTIHSAKGLEWKAVFMIWALEGRFPSARSVDTMDAVEEERRLFYVGCTRAKDDLYITYPTNIYDRESGFVLSDPSRFIKDINESLADFYLLANEDEE